MTDDEKREETEIRELTARLERLRQNRRKRRSRPRPASDNPVGRPRTPADKLKVAKHLARTFPLPDVALVTGISLSTLYEYGIKRYRLNAEARAEQEAAQHLKAA